MRSFHVVNRKGVFYWRRRLPVPIATAFGRAQLLISLRSRDPKVGQRVGRVLSVQFDHFLLRMQLEQRTPSQLEQGQILQQLYQSVIQGCREERARWYHHDELPPRELMNAGPQLPLDHPAVLADNEVQNFFMDPADTAKSLRGDLGADRYASIRWLLKPILPQRGIDPETEATAFRQFLRLAIHMAAKAFDDAEQDINGDAPIGLEALVEAGRAALNLGSEPTAGEPTNFNAIKPTLQPVQTEAVSTAPLLSYFEERYLEEQRPHVSGGTIGQKAASLKILLRTIGDIQADKITRDLAAELRRILERLPSNYGKSESHRSTPIAKIALKKPGEATLGINALERHWRTIVGFYKWVNVQDGVAPIQIDRIFGQFRWHPAVPQGEDRSPWPSESIRTLMTSPVYTGFQPHPEKREARDAAGDVVIRDEYWWLPLLALYHGPRLEELCQLRGTDIVEDESDHIWFMNFHKGMKLKNEASIRKVPIHSAVIDLGFLALAEGAGSNLLFSKLVQGGRDNKYGYEYSQDFTKYRRAIGVYQKLIDFHSFRHNATTKLLDEGERTTLEVDELTGHDSEERKHFKRRQRSQSLEYFGGFRLSVLKEAIETISYPEIDLRRLAAASANSEQNETMLAVKYPYAWGAKAGLRQRRRKKKVA